MIGGVVGFLILGGMLAVTAGLIVLAVVLGWIVGLLVSPPARAALVALAAVVVGFVAIWAFGRVEGGVLDPITYLLEVEGPIVVGLSLIGAGGLAAAASR